VSGQLHTVVTVVLALVGLSAAAIGFCLWFRALMKPPRRLGTYGFAVAGLFFLASFAGGVAVWFIGQPYMPILIAIAIGSLLLAFLMFFAVVIPIGIWNWGATKLRDLQQEKNRNDSASGPPAAP